MINTVLFDMGGTLEDIVNTPSMATQTANMVGIVLKERGLYPSRNTNELARILVKGMAAYEKSRNISQIELKPEEIWTKFLLAESGLNLHQIATISEELAYAWETTYYLRTLRPGVKAMLEGLSAMKLKLGIISNTASLYQVFRQLEDYGIREYFSDVTLSSQVGYRKPHPGIFQISLLQMRSEAQQSIYVGDTVSRDIVGAKNAGFAYTIQILSQLTKDKDKSLKDAPKADYTINDITDVLSICQSLV